MFQIKEDLKNDDEEIKVIRFFFYYLLEEKLMFLIFFRKLIQSFKIRLHIRFHVMFIITSG